MLRKFDNLIKRINQWCQTHPAPAYMLTGLFFLLAWLPWYLTYFPGVVRHDEILCVQQALGELALSNHQPIVFVLFIKLVLILVTGPGGTINAAIAVGTGLQMCFLALVLSFAVSFIRQRTTSGWCFLSGVVFFAFSPIVALYSVVLCKDTFFTGWLLLYCILVYKICMEGWLGGRNRKNILKFTALTVMVGISRSNGMYIAVLMFIILLVTVKEARKAVLVSGISAFLVLGLIKGPVFTILHVQSPSVAESFSVPIQQIGNTLAKGGTIREEDLEYLDGILPIEEWKASYDSSVSDPIKFNEQFNRSRLDQTSVEFLKVWFRGLIPNFKYYVEAYLDLMRGYWDISYIVNIDSTDVSANTYGIERADCLKQWTGLSLEPLLALLVLVMRKLPVVNIFTNQMILFLLFLTVVLLWGRGNEKRKAMLFYPLLLLYLTLLIAAPVSSEFRYMLPFHFMLPVLLWSGVECGKELKKQKRDLKKHGNV